MWQRLYKGGSNTENGTLQQLRNLIGRRNVGQATDVKGHVNEIEDFLELIVNCHMVAAALHFFSMSSLDDQPHTNAFPASFSSWPAEKKKKALLEKLVMIIDRYVIPEQFCIKLASSQESQSPLHPYQCTSVHQSVTDDQMMRNPHYRIVAHDHNYATPSIPLARRARHLPSTLTHVLDRSDQASVAIQRIGVDGVYNYASAVLNDGLLLLEFHDAVREGDGPRILRCWKVMLLYFHSARHHNYAIEAIRLLAMVNAMATERVAAQITWSRVVNTRGSAGHNIPVDLMNEHLNRSLKDAVGGIGANVTEKTITQCGRSLNGLRHAVHNFDKENDLHPDSLEHNRPSLEKDRKLAVEELLSSRVFDYVPGRAHHSFRTIKSNVAQLVNLDKLVETVERHKAALQAEQRVSKMYNHNY